MKFLQLVFLLSPAFAQYCPPIGPVLPDAKNLSTNPSVLQAGELVSEALQNLTTLSNTTALSVGVGSVESGKLMQYSYTPSIFNTSGTSTVNGDTVFITGSVAKVFTVFAIQQLLAKGKILLSDPITKYVPELLQLARQQTTQNAITTVDWNAITLEALSSQLAGISAELGDEDLANDPSLTTTDLAAFGLLPLPQDSSAQCQDGPEERPCTWTDFFDYFGMKEPVYAPYTTPVYTNIGYDLLGQVIENVTGLNYAQYMQQCVLEPLNLPNTFLETPSNTTIGFIPNGTNWWSTPYGFQRPSGNFYSSLNDFLTFGTAILSSKLLPTITTSAWLKPKTFTSSTGIFVGSPWEIARGSNLTSDGRVIDFYTKSGSIGDYFALLVLVPDLDVVMSIFLAGDDASFDTMYGILTLMVESMIPAIDNGTKKEASQTYAGTYVDVSTNSTLVVSVDDGPGLLISNFTIRGADVITAYATMNEVNPAVTFVRLYPTDLEAGESQAWRAVYSLSTLAEDAEENSQLFFEQGSCQSWSSIDLLSYGLRGLDDFIFTIDANGTVDLEPRAWRVVLSKND